MYTTCSELVVFMFKTGKSMNNQLSYCGLVDPRINASDKDLPVKVRFSSLKLIKGIYKKCEESQKFVNRHRHNI